MEETIASLIRVVLSSLLIYFIFHILYVAGGWVQTGKKFMETFYGVGGNLLHRAHIVNWENAPSNEEGRWMRGEKISFDESNIAHPPL